MLQWISAIHDSSNSSLRTKDVVPSLMADKPGMQRLPENDYDESDHNKSTIDDSNQKKEVNNDDDDDNNDDDL